MYSADKNMVSMFMPVELLAPIFEHIQDGCCDD